MGQKTNPDEHIYETYVYCQGSESSESSESSKGWKVPKVPSVQRERSNFGNPVLLFLTIALTFACLFSKERPVLYKKYSQSDATIKALHVSGVSRSFAPL